jgi:hypothetical protein
MSEFQYVGFRAVDAPLTDKQLEYMENQSSRAEITRWSFNNEYHYGDFRGNPAEMLRRGYDVHLHYANFGIRTIMFRLPQGLPASKVACKKYMDGENVRWQPDSKGPAGILTVSAMTEPGSLEELWDVDEYLDRIVGVRQQLIDGDMRSLYVAWMCGCQGDEVDPDFAKEPPVPAGLGDPSESIAAMLEFFDLSPFDLAAAAEQSPPLAEIPDRNAAMAGWIESVDAPTLRQWLLRCLTGEPAAIKAECLRTFRKSSPLPKWPTTKGARSMTELMQLADQLAEVEKEKEEKRKQQARRKRLADMAKSPDKYLEEVNRHVALRGRDEYEAAAQILSDLREAIGGTEGDKLARKHATRLKKKHPTLKMLTGALRRKGLLS